MSKKTPQIRFKGFTDDWEERKLGDITKISTGKLDANAMVENGKYDFYTSGIKKYRIDVAAFEGPSITIAGNGATVGYMHLADNKFNAYQRTYVLQEFLVDRSFIFSEIGNKLPKKIKQEARTGNIPYIVMDMLTELKLSIPQNNSEQQKIGSFFKQLDDTIDLHQRKLDLLKEQKKGFLQKMFPKNGAKIPELRFEGFSDDWEERKLGDLSQDTIGGGTPKTSVTEFWNGEIPWIQSSDLANDKLYGVLPKKFITEDAVKNSATKLIPANSIAIVTRVGVGKLAFMPYEFASSQDFLSLSNLQVDCNFGMYSIYKMLQRELNNVQGTSIKGITKADLLDKETFVPIKVEEQQKIGSFFKQIDDTIALHQRKLDLLKEQKKGFLQKMFVS